MPTTAVSRYHSHIVAQSCSLRERDSASLASRTLLRSQMLRMLYVAQIQCRILEHGGQLHLSRVLGRGVQMITKVQAYGSHTLRDANVECMLQRTYQVFA